MKLDVYIVDPVKFCKGGPCLLHSLYFDNAQEEKNGPTVPDSWVFLQTVEVDETLVDTGKVLEAAQAELNQKEKETMAEYAAKMEVIKATRAELLALPGVAK